MESPISLTPTRPRPVWVAEFTMRLGEVAPSMPPVEAQRFAEQTFIEAADLDPREAAEIFALELPPGDVGAP